MAYDPLNPFGPTPYPVDPLAQLFSTAFQVAQSQKAQRERDALIAAERQQRERTQLLQDYELLTNLIQRYQGAGQEVPQPILARVNDLQTRLMGVGLPTAMGRSAPEVGGTAGRLMQGAGVTPQPRLDFSAPKKFQYPGFVPQFRSLAEMGRSVGLKVKPGVDPNQSPLTLRQQGVDLNTLFVSEREERQEAQAAARSRLEQIGKVYSLQQIFSTPQLRDPFLRDYETVYGKPFPTQQVPQTAPVAIAGQRPEEGSLGQVLSPRGQQTIQVPTGQTIEQPILPQQLSSVTLGDLVPGLKQGNPALAAIPAPLAKEYGIDIDKLLTDDKEKGKVARQASIFQEALAKAGGDYNKAYRIASAAAPDLFPPQMQPELHPLVAANIISQMGERAVRVKQLLAGGGAAGGLTAAQQRILSNYNRLTDQRLDILKTLSAGVVDSATKQRLERDLQSLDRKIEQLEPQVDKLLFGSSTAPLPTDSGTAPPFPPNEYKGRYLQSPSGETWYSDGTTWTKATAPGAPPSPRSAPLTVSSDVSSVIRSLATALKRQKVDYAVARIRIFDELRRRRINLGDPNITSAVDAVVNEVYGVKR